MTIVVQLNRSVTVMHITKKVKASSNRKVSTNSLHPRLLHKALHSCKSVRVPVLNHVHSQKYFKWTCEHHNWAWPDKSLLLYHVDSQVHLCHLPEEMTAPVCAMEPLCMFCWQTLAHLDGTWTRHLPKHCCSPTTPLHRNSIPYTNTSLRSTRSPDLNPAEYLWVML